jgi:hypothetical protein
MSTIRAGATGYYSIQEALKAAEQLIDLLQQEHARGFFQLEDVTLLAKTPTSSWWNQVGLRLAFHGSGKVSVKACLQGGAVRMAAGIWTVMPPGPLFSQARG